MRKDGSSVFAEINSSGLAALTGKEREVLQLIVEGYPGLILRNRLAGADVLKVERLI